MRSLEAMNASRIVFNRPSLAGDELTAIRQAVESGHLAGAGPFTRQCEQLLEREVGVHRAMLTTSCTDALEMCGLLLDLQPGDDVILPSFTFVSTASAFVLRGARPVFVDIRPDTLNLDESLLEQRITPRTRAIVVVHYGGVACEMDTVLRIAGRYGIPVIEDNAHGLFATYKGRSLGTFGRFATQSFHDTKNFTCGEGGALLINDKSAVERADILLQKGTNRSQFFRGQVDKYTWVDLGSSFLPSELLAAFLFVQLQAREQIQARRKQIWDRYYAGLSSWAGEQGIVLPTVPDTCEQAYHLFYMLLPAQETRQELIAFLKERGIASAFHYLPLHLSPMGQRYGYFAGDLPVTESVSDRLLRLPFFNSLTAADQERVIDTVLEFNARGQTTRREPTPTHSLNRAA